MYSAQVRAAAQTNPPASDRIALKGYDPVAYFTLVDADAGRRRIRLCP